MYDETVDLLSGSDVYDDVDFVVYFAVWLTLTWVFTLALMLMLMFSDDRC